MNPDERTQRALHRLEASRARLMVELMPPADAGFGAASDLRHPWRFLRRWWQQTQPLDLLQDWVAARASGEPMQGVTPAAAAVLDAGELVLDEARDWIRRHPAASMAIAAGLGAVAISQRRHLVRGFGVLRGVASRRTRAWVIGWASNPLLYQALFSFWAAHRPEPVKPAAGSATQAEPLRKPA
ncbi:hypothetical protein [Ideonella margarita]|uniref:DUF2867 domain-containing protein n=1 Tax=Ideonella margarita TaxID=2984191 RepID=A0ABU9C3F7_9BURK